MTVTAAYTRNLTDQMWVASVAPRALLRLGRMLRHPTCAASADVPGVGGGCDRPAR